MCGEYGIPESDPDKTSDGCVIAHESGDYEAASRKMRGRWANDAYLVAIWDGTGWGLCPDLHKDRTLLRWQLDRLRLFVEREADPRTLVGQEVLEVFRMAEKVSRYGTQRPRQDVFRLEVTPAVREWLRDRKGEIGRLFSGAAARFAKVRRLFS